MARNRNFDEDEVVEKAVKLFWKQGYSKTSPDDLVNSLGLSRSSLYNTFGDKKELFLTSLKKYIDTKSKALIESLDSSENAENTITDILYSIIDHNQSENQYGCLLINTTVEFFDQDESIRDLLTKNKLEIIEAISRLIYRGQKDNIIKNKENPDKIAYFIYNNMIGLRVNVRGGANDNELRTIVEMTKSILK